MAKLIVEIASGEKPNDSFPVVDKAAVKRGKARAQSLTPAERSAIARTAAKARWKK